MLIRNEKNQIKSSYILYDSPDIYKQTNKQKQTEEMWAQSLWCVHLLSTADEHSRSQERTMSIHVPQYQFQEKSIDWVLTE